jgi:copper transport protein
VLRTRWLIAGLTSAGIVLALPVPASAHAVLESSSPAAGTQLDAAPRVLTLNFSESVDPGLSSVTVTDTGGASLAAGGLEAVSATSLKVGLVEMAEQIGIVTWRAYSRVDGHVTVGSFAFGVGVDPTGVEIVEPKPPPPTILSIGGRTLFLAGLALLLGAATLAVTGAPGQGLWAMSGTAISLLGLAAFGHQQRLDSGASAMTFLGTPIGLAILYRGAALGAAGLFAAAMRRWKRAAIGVLLAGAAAAAVHVANGHAGAFGMRDIIGQTVHVVAVGAWAGGLLPLAWLLARHGGEAATYARRFSGIALPAVVLIVLTGSFRSWNEVGGLSGLTASGYGWTLIVKVALLIGVLALAWVNRQKNLPKATADAAPLRRTVAKEAVLVGAIIAASGVLANLAPPVDPTAEASFEMRASGTSFAGDLAAEIIVNPGLPGPNRVTVELSDPIAERALDDVDASLRVRYRGRPGSEPIDVELEHEGEGVYAADTSAFSLPGPYEVTILAQGSARSRQVLTALATPTPQDVSVIDGSPSIYDIRADDGSSIQMYLDPGEAGTNEVHATFFGPDGKERDDLSDFVVTGTRDVGVRVFVLRQFSPGHVVANATLEAGRWRFDATAETSDGAVLSAWFVTEL